MEKPKKIDVFGQPSHSYPNPDVYGQPQHEYPAINTSFGVTNTAQNYMPPTLAESLIKALMATPGPETQTAQVSPTPTSTPTPGIQPFYPAIPGNNNLEQLLNVLKNPSGSAPDVEKLGPVDIRKTPTPEPGVLQQLQDLFKK